MDSDAGQHRQHTVKGIIVLRVTSLALWRNRASAPISDQPFLLDRFAEVNDVIGSPHTLSKDAMPALSISIINVFLEVKNEAQQNLVRSDRFSTLSACLMSGACAREKTSVPTTVAVSGGIIETPVHFHATKPHGVQATLIDTMSGDLAGTGLINIYSSQQDGENTINVLGTRIWHLAEGQLFTSEVGAIVGEVTTVHSTVTGGTGVYKGATGDLTLLGAHFPDHVEFTYSGTLVLLK